MNFQIRLRGFTEWKDVYELIEDYTIECQFGFAFFHQPSDDNPHFHIYLFGLNKQDQSIRKYLGKYLDKTRFAVKTTCGGKKNLPIEPNGAWQYATTKELLEPVWTKNLSEEIINVASALAKRYYHPEEETRIPQNGDTIVIIHDHHHFKQDKVWERLKENQAKYKDKSVAMIKSMICAEWLNMGRAMPRPSDLHRYATSLYYLNQYEGEIPEDALFLEFKQ